MAAPAALGLAAARLAGRAKDLAHAAAVDPLTSLFNRRYFETRIDEEIQRARRYGLDLALLMIDADNFKALNDTLGHLVGDRVLRAMSDTLRRSVRAFDVCTRFGGEEFAILMPGSSAASALQSAERIRQRVERYPFDPRVIPPDDAPDDQRRRRRADRRRLRRRTSSPAPTARSTRRRRPGRTACGWRGSEGAGDSSTSAAAAPRGPGRRGRCPAAACWRARERPRCPRQNSRACSRGSTGRRRTLSS